MDSFLLRFGRYINIVLSDVERFRFRGESRWLKGACGVDRYLYQQHVATSAFLTSSPS